MPIKSLVFIAWILALTACSSGNGESDAADAGEAAAMEEAQAAMPDGGSELNQPASLTDDDQTWIQYGVSGAPELNLLFTNSASMAEHGVTIGLGPYVVTAVSTSGECRTKVDVTPTLVAGRYTCTGSTGYNNQTREMGKVDIEVEFSAGS